MDARTQMLEYAHKHNDGTMTDQEFFGMMLTDGVVINRTPNSKLIARAERKDGVVTVTETTVTKSNDFSTGKLITSEQSETVEVLRVTL